MRVAATFLIFVRSEGFGLSDYREIIDKKKEKDYLKWRMSYGRNEMASAY